MVVDDPRAAQILGLTIMRIRVNHALNIAAAAAAVGISKFASNISVTRQQAQALKRKPFKRETPFLPRENCP